MNKAIFHSPPGFYTDHGGDGGNVKYWRGNQTANPVVINYGDIVFDDTMDILRKHFCARKIIRISTQKPLPELTEPGITVINPISRFDAELELDVSVMEVNQFIETINRQSIIKVLAIQKLPIESVIKELYKA